MAKDREFGKSDIDITSLCRVINRDRLAMVRPRQTILNMAREVAGPYFSEEAAPKDVVVNLLGVYQTITSQNLIPKAPRAMLSTFRRSLKPTVEAMQSWANNQIEHIKLANTLRRVVINSLYSFGVCQVSLADPALAAAQAWNLRAGEPNCWNIDVDDFIGDMHARDWWEMSYRAHRFRVPFDVVKDSKLYSKWARAKIQPSYDSLYNQQGDERISMIGRTTYAGDTEEFEPMIDLWQVYLPRHKKVLILAEDQISGPMSESSRGEALREMDWIGPEWGPYLMNGFGIVPGNWMPKGPMQDLYKLHLMENKTLRKLDRAINERLKEVTVVLNGDTKLQEGIQQANDGDIIPGNPQNVAQLVMGGQHAQLLVAMGEQFKNLFDFVGGNIALLGGRSPQSRTATQDKMLNENATAGIQDLQEQTTEFVSKVVESMCWYWWHDPKLVMHTKHTLPGLPDMETAQRVYPAGYQNAQGQSPRLERKGRFEDMQIRVDPYSLQRSSPQKKMQDLNNIMQTIIIPMMQLLVQQGKAVDIDAYLEKVSQWMDMPDLADIITIQEPPEQDARQGLGDKPAMPDSTNREYTRHNVSQRTPQSDSQNLMSQMMGHEMGGDNRNGQGRPWGVA